MIGSLTNKECELMKLLWENKDGITFKELCDSIKAENHSVSPKTINTHLTHLIDKGFVRAEGVKRKRLYYPQILQSEYENRLARHIVEQLFEGSFNNFVSAFTFSEGLTEREALALKALLEKKEG